MKRKICIITGTRADYGILFPVIKKISASSELEAKLIVTGMHLMKEFGYTVSEIKKDGIRIESEIDISYSEDSGQAMAGSIGRAISLFVSAFARIKPDFIMVLGDRGEMLAAAIAGDYLNIPVVHLHGGEISGHVDGLVRHAITKLSHLHFPATAEAAKRLLKLGEEPWRVTVAGAPALDTILNEQLPSTSELIDKYQIDISRPLILLAQHPVSTESAEAGEQIKATLSALLGFDAQTIVIYPNADAGGRMMIEEIKTYEKTGRIKAFKSVPHKDYLGLMKIADILVGNSSSGLIEAPSFKLPVVNIGSRQAGRERGANVIDAANNKKAICQAVRRALCDKKFLSLVKRTKNPYGDGRASDRIAKKLAAIKLDNRLLEKRMTY